MGLYTISLMFPVSFDIVFSGNIISVQSTCTFYPSLKVTMVKWFINISQQYWKVFDIDLLVSLRFSVVNVLLLKMLTVIYATYIHKTLIYWFKTFIEIRPSDDLPQWLSYYRCCNLHFKMFTIKLMIWRCKIMEWK